MFGCAQFGWPVAWALVLGVLGSVHPGVIMAIGTLSARPENRTVGMSLFYTLYYLGGSVAPAEAIGALGLDVRDRDFWRLGLAEIERLVDSLTEEAH